MAAERLLELEVGGPVAGGACIARYEGRVVFVRHALPGERVRAIVTDDRTKFLRADAVEILTAAPERVAPPCPYAGPGKCGGCDWQHASGTAQRAMKAQVVRDQFARIAGIEVADLLTDVEALPGGLLGWRQRIGYAVDRDGRPGLHRHRSADVEHVGRCRLGVPGVGDAALLSGTWPGLLGVDAIRGDDADVTVLGRRPGPGLHARGRRPPDRVSVLSGPDRIHYSVGERRFDVAADGFWQVHPAAAEVLGAALLAAIGPRADESVLDLYAGAGAFTAALAQAVGPGGRVLGIEAAPQAVADADGNLADLPWASVQRGRVTGRAVREAGDVDVVVLDPPRAGAGREVVEAITTAGPRVIGYVSCDPGTLARDVAVAVEGGWRLTGLRVFDAFPMTHHVECVATLCPPSGP